MKKETTITFETTTNPLETILNLQQSVCQFLDSMYDFYNQKDMDEKELFALMARNHAIIGASLMTGDADAFSAISKMLKFVYLTFEDKLPKEEEECQN
jgi:hypothetical protein